MRIRPTSASIVALVAIFAPSLVTAQQAGSLLSPQTTPVVLDEPRPFPASGGFEAKPLNAAAPPGPQRGHRPVDVRLLSAEQPITKQSSQPPRRLNPRSEPTRPHSQKPAAPTPSSAVTTVGGSLALVLGLFLIIAWCARRFTPGGTAILPKEAVELLGRTSLATRQQAHLVRVGNKLLLVAISPAGAETLTEITEPTEVEHLTALCRRGKPSSSTIAFRQALTELANEPAPAGFVGVSRPSSKGAR